MFAMARQPDPRAKSIEEALLRLDLSARWLAEKIGRQHSTVLQWLKGTKPHDPSVWDQMFEAIQEGQKERESEQNPKINRTPRLTLPVLPSTYMWNAEKGDYPPDVQMETVTIAQPDNDRRNWTRRVESPSLEPLARQSDVLVFDTRDWEVGNLVEAIYQGKALSAVASGTKAQPRLCFPNASYPESIESGFVIVGVAWMRRRLLENGVVETLEFPFGVRHDPK